MHLRNDHDVNNKNKREDYPLVLTAKEISEILQVSKPIAYQLMNRNDFPTIGSIGRCKRVLREEFFEWISNQ
ncbi:helix-turn-helix domain-containing protein [Bacillus sp. EB106-08-02-XG196]|uniref:helix-turn-helix domain-containing protein n=1 Tax=Bacillus sp. EB106-08-02-XG196 TaxID=2737049 RepID=UPI0015C4B5A4|nr:helix-turn-helix domain-containing protein [Bacillus sp. EB106-08-02-XG196]NWQ40354.1 helix-turn-helix domain-containing protein [Bacillus sp. EB106-08-02-XG196]